MLEVNHIYGIGKLGEFYFIVDDPRDAERENEKKVNGTVRLYEFPNKVESKLKEEITDPEEGRGSSIFDPSKGGYNFLLKILATKKDQNGNSWPDYTNSTFSRKPTALGDEDEIEKIMSTVIDINEYIEGLKKTDDDIEQLLMDENLMDMIQDEWDRFRANQGDAPAPASEARAEEPNDEKAEKVEDGQEEKVESDDELLAELENM